MSESLGYASPMAFRRALTDKLKAAAKTSKWELPQLQRQIAFERRGIPAPDRFTVPDAGEWKRGYERAAAESLLDAYRTFEEALDLVGRFIDPLLGDRTVGIWDPASASWTP